jgi:hypothetical protein
MKIADLAHRLPPGGLFRTGLILSGQANPASVRRQLDRWTKSGRIVQLRRGVYVLQKPYATAGVHPFAAANALKKASYVSLQSALAHYGMIPEYVPVTTSVTTGRPEEIETPVGRFEFRHTKPSRFFGFGETEIAPDQPALIATPQKALVDLLHLSPHSDEVVYLRELRLARPDGFDLTALAATVERQGSRKVARAVRRLLRLWEEAA